MSRIRTYARNLASNWAGYALNLVVLLLLSPYVVHSLDQAAYGLWALLTSMTGYLGLADLGVRGGLGRFINHYLAQDDDVRVNGIFNTALVFFLACGVLLAGACAVISSAFGLLFPKVPIELLEPARLTVWLIGLNLWLSFFCAAFTQVLTAQERFDWSNAVDLGALALRSGGTVVVLAAGGGIIELAEVQVLSTLAALAAVWWLARKAYPALRVRPSLISRARFVELFGFSIWAMVGGVASQLLYWTDAIVIAALLGVEQVTVYSIGGMLIIHVRALVQRCSAIFFPQIVKHCANDDRPALRQFYQRSASVVMVFAIPLLVGLVAFGREFMVRWMGPQFDRSYTVLAILAVSQFPAAAFAVGSHVFAGLNRVRLGALLTLGQGLANLALTLVLVSSFDLGIEAVAWGTFGPRVAFALLCGGLTLRWIGLSWGDFVRQTAWRWAVLTAGFAAICLATATLPTGDGWAGFFVRVGLASAGYVPLAWFAAASRSDRQNWQVALQGRWQRAAA